MGILNVTPDSFSDGGKYLWSADAVEHAQEMIVQRDDILDLGAESTRLECFLLPPASLWGGE